MIADNSFRVDLYYRLSVFPILLPPLRDRPEGIRAELALVLERSSERPADRPGHNVPRVEDENDHDDSVL